MSSWWIYEATEAAESEEGDKKHLETYLEDGEDVNFGSDHAEVADVYSMLREQLGV